MSLTLRICLCTVCAIHAWGQPRLVAGRARVGHGELGDFQQRMKISKRGQRYTSILINSSQGLKPARGEGRPGDQGRQVQGLRVGYANSENNNLLTSVPFKLVS
ncbi:hypothetical protein BV22DRAFT_1033649 [Leucogyrophana mollusca]|uniref:Uncharacterized protein n=1 Tax=Leucogyrophana mollusca TaxID=85980 RepID=A0ACB8BIP7_9AGAM|nr:hypothetical protein BV22DRAFT_1033649 [Leucogyrophana mollusca]